MGQQVNRSSEVKSPSESDWTIILNLMFLPFLFRYAWFKEAKNFKIKSEIVAGKLLLLDPKPGDLTKTRL